MNENVIENVADCSSNSADGTVCVLRLKRILQRNRQHIAQTAEQYKRDLAVYICIYIIIVRRERLYLLNIHV